MAKKCKFVFLTISLVIISQLSSADIKPIKEDAKSKEDLLAYALLEFSYLASKTLERGVEILKKTLIDMHAVQKRTDADNEDISKIEDFLQQVDRTLKQPALDENVKYTLEMFFQFVTLINPNHEDDKPFTRRIEIEKLLDKNGIAILREHFDSDFVPIIDDFGKKVTKYFIGLNEAQQEAEKGLVKWLERLSNEENTAADKIIIFFAFTDTFSDIEKAKKNYKVY